MKPAVYTIPAGQCFADALALGILEMAHEDPLSLSACTVLLPNRRACRTLRDAFLRLSGGKAVLLPRLHPIGEVDADEVSLLAAEGAALDVPPAISPLERQLVLARMILKSGLAESFDQAAALAKELGRFLDEVQTERLSFDGLQQLVPEIFAEHWQKTLEFLKILTAHWPDILKERGVIDPAARRDLLIAAQIKAWELHPPQYPVIAAGSTGATPAVADLLHLVARLPQGKVVLPALDTRMDAESWDVLGEDHPQFNTKMLLSQVGIDRADVKIWELKQKTNINHARVHLLSEAMRPAETTEKWRRLQPGEITSHALDGLTRIDCDTPQEEADVIALILREALETKGKTATVITADRQLAHRITLSLQRWGLGIDDSGGQPLTALPAGSWLTLTAEMAQEHLSPVTLLSCLKHPIMAAAMTPGQLRGMTHELDQMVLRGPRPSPGFQGLRDAVIPVARRDAANGKKLLDWIAKLEPMMSEFTNLMADHEDIPFRKLLEAHIRMAEQLASTPEIKGADRLWSHEAGEAGSEFLSELLAASEDVPPLSPSHYTALLGLLLKTVTVRPRYGMHPRLTILGQIEARLFCADLVIVAGLNEGTWPAFPPQDPWMSRPIRRTFGLPAPERNIGIAALDFVLAATSCEAVLTRSRKVEGVPTVPARWLLRLETVLKAAGLTWNEAPATRYRQWALDLDTPAAITPAPRPAPRPPVSARPRELSVTQIETWMRDPYQIYAREVLNLRALDPVDADAGGAERGNFIHKALEEFIRAYPGELPPDAAQKLLELGRNALESMRVPREVVAFWWPRFEDIAVRFTEQEREWRQQARNSAVEIKGAWNFESASGKPFILTGKADRIDKFSTGEYAVIDYKSGAAPENSDVLRGLAPQLPLEAVMLGKGAFPGLPAGETKELVYWRVTGSGQKPVERKTVSPADVTVTQLAAEAEAGLRALVDEFDREQTPYLSQPRPEAKPRYSDYDHLARVKEWGVAGEEDAA